MILNRYSVVPIAGRENHVKNYCPNHARIIVSSLLEEYLHVVNGINLESPLIIEFIDDFFAVIPTASAISNLITATVANQESFFFRNNLHPQFITSLADPLKATIIADSCQCPSILLLGSATLNMEGYAFVLNN